MPTDYRIADWTTFTRVHRWTLMADDAALTALSRRWTRSLEITDSVIVPAGDASYIVNSATDPDITYLVDQDGCSCPDSSDDRPKSAPFGWCKHRLAAWRFELHGAEHPKPTQLSDDETMALVRELYEAA